MAQKEPLNNIAIYLLTMKKKFKYAPHAMFVAIPIFLMSMIFLIYVFKTTIISAIIVSLGEYIFAAHSNMITHYLQSQIDDLKKQKSK
jgi:hypothetical protein